MYKQIITCKVINLWLSTLVWEIILISEYINIVYKSFKRYLHKHNYMTVKQMKFFQSNAKSKHQIM